MARVIYLAIMIMAIFSTLAAADPCLEFNQPCDKNGERKCCDNYKCTNHDGGLFNFCLLL